MLACSGACERDGGAMAKGEEASERWRCDGVCWRTARGTVYGRVGVIVQTRELAFSAGVAGGQTGGVIESDRTSGRWPYVGACRASVRRTRLTG